MKIIRGTISEDRGLDQTDILYQLFTSFLDSDEAEAFNLDYGQVCRWLNGQAKVSPQITAYYMKPVHQPALVDDLEKNILPLLVDEGMAAQNLYELVIHDNSVSEQKKLALCRYYPCSDSIESARFIADLLLFALERTFVKRDPQTKELIATGSLSPMVKEYVLDAAPPKPCRWFCGRTKELEQIDALLRSEGKVFLYGIAGIGKSELAKAYVAEHRKDYINILYFTYTGDLRQDIIDLDFVDDLPSDSDEERFRKHHRFLRSLKEDSLLVVDNCNATETHDDFLPLLLKYHCRVLITTRSKIAGRVTFSLEEIVDRTALFQLAAYFYADAVKYRDTVEQIIETVHAHTFAVELAARLLEHGILSPSELLQKLQVERTSLDTSDQIGADKDGRRQKATYYGHMHTLFSLYMLSEQQQTILRGLSLVPLTGIPTRQFAGWMGQRDMNGINELIEMGIIQEKPCRTVALHPMMQEITITNAKPSVTNCGTLLNNLREICLLHGQDTPNYKTLFQTIENGLHLLIRDDDAALLLLIEDAYPYMEKYRYEQGMSFLLKEMSRLLQNPLRGKVKDRALLLDFSATYEDCFRKKGGKAIKLEKDALALLTEIDAENAHLAANLHGNLGGLYKSIEKYDLAKQHMEQGISILREYGLTYTNDMVIQTVNYAVLLGDMGNPALGIDALRKVAMLVKQYNSDGCLDYAIINEAEGCLHLMLGHMHHAEQCFDTALNIYRSVYADAPELLEEKQMGMQGYFAQAGLNLASHN